MNELTLSPENQNSLEQELKQNPLYNLAHPYSRYGLAVALVRLDKWMNFEDIETVTKKDLIEILIQEIESGLSNFRFETFDNPETAEELRFVPIKFEKLQQNKSLVQGKLSEIGKYLAPTIVTTDGDAKSTFENAENIISDLRDGEKLSSIYTLSRSFAPTTSKINNGRGSQSPPKTTLFECACSIIATLTEIKPASWIATRNTVIIPDLPLDELKEFVELFGKMIVDEANSNQMTAKVKKATESNSEKTDNKKEKSLYHRPPIFNGNYPFAPRNSAFGAVGLLAAIGRWAVRAKEESWAEKVLNSLAGKPLYVISYDKIFQVQFSHHVINLAIKDKLSTLIDKLAFDTKLYSEIENDEKKKERWKIPNYQLFDLMTNRFLQLFDKPTFRDFLAFRAEYASEVNILFEEYFMKENKIDREIVESAKAYGQWLNLTAYLVANEETKDKTQQDLDKQRRDLSKQKAKILVGFESAIMSGKTPQDMLHRISTQAGRLLQSDAPAKATKFMDEVMCGEKIDAETAQQMLIAYMRLRTEKETN
jgi:hypothetical protein